MKLGYNLEILFSDEEPGGEIIFRDKNKIKNEIFILIRLDAKYNKFGFFSGIKIYQIPIDLNNISINGLNY